MVYMKILSNSNISIFQSHLLLHFKQFLNLSQIHEQYRYLRRNCVCKFYNSFIVFFPDFLDDTKDEIIDPRTAAASAYQTTSTPHRNRKDRRADRKDRREDRKRKQDRQKEDKRQEDAWHMAKLESLHRLMSLELEFQDVMQYGAERYRCGNIHLLLYIHNMR